MDILTCHGWQFCLVECFAVHWVLRGMDVLRGLDLIEGSPALIRCQHTRLQGGRLLLAKLLVHHGLLRGRGEALIALTISRPR